MWGLLGYDGLHEHSARTAAGGEDRTPLPGLRPQAVLRRHPTYSRNGCRPHLGQLPLGRKLRRAVAHQAHRGRGRRFDLQGPHPLDQRWAHGRLLFGGGARDQARGARRGTVVHTQRGVARGRRPGRGRGACCHLRLHQRRDGRRGRLGHPHGHRHSLRPRCLGPARREGAGGPQGVLDGSCHSGRHSGGLGDRPLLHLGDFVGSARSRGGFPRGPRRGEPDRGGQDAGLRRAGGRAVALLPALWGPRNHSRGAPSVHGARRLLHQPRSVPRP